MANFTMKINGKDMECELEQKCRGDQVLTRLTVGKRELENSTGSSDCYMNVDLTPQEELEEYVKDAIFRDWDCLLCKIEEEGI